MDLRGIGTIYTTKMASEQYRALLPLFSSKVQSILPSLTSDSRFTALRQVLTSLLSTSERLQIQTSQSSDQLSYLLGLEFLEATYHRFDQIATLEGEQISVDILTAELEILSKSLETSLYQPVNDLLNEEKGSARWKQLWESVEYIAAPDLQRLEKDLATLHQRFMTYSAAISLGLDTQNPVMRRLLVGAGLPYYKLRPGEAVKRAQWNAICPTIETIRLLLAVTESQLGQRVYASLLPPITVSRLIHIPRVSQLTPDTGIMVIPQQVGRRKKSSFSLTPKVSRPSVPVRVISPFGIESLEEEGGGSWCCGAQGIEPAKTVEKVIFHIHGGGWICMSSRTHENHTRQWATMTRTPVLSVDYRLAPEFPYPAALDDVWDAYIWTLRHAKTNLGIDPHKIVVVGDSAGGGLALALTYRALTRRVRPPDGLLLVYSALSADGNRPTPSYLLGLKDPMLSLGLMDLCARSYTPEDANPSSDYYLSPILAPDNLLQQLPPVRLIAGSKDPLLDDSWRLFDRLKRLGTDVKMSLFEGMPHGLLNLDLPMGLKQAHEVVTTGSDYLKELLYLATRR